MSRALAKPAGNGHKDGSIQPGKCQPMNETVISEKGMVVAPHRAAAEAGAEILHAGGNVLEAIIGAAATIAVVYPHMNSIGGDGFMLIAEPGRPPRALMACGGAGSLATIERYARKGYDTIPTRGADAALTVAGAVSAWQLAHEISQSWGGGLALSELLGDAILRAKAGSPVTRSQERMTRDFRDELAAVPGFGERFLVDGKAPATGSLLRQPKLAETLEHLAHSGFDDFYRGDVAREIAADLEAAGSPVVRDDLRKHEARLASPLSLAIKGATLFNTPPPTQGLASLLILGLFGRLAVKRGESFEHLHGLVEATKRAFAIRDGHVTDPFYGDPVTDFLAPERIAAEADAIDRRRAAPWGRRSGKGDTVWMGAIDRKGRAVSFIQSIFWEFGSGLVLPKTGVLWQNRGISFSLDKAARNPLMPGRKPFHTLNPPLARFDDGRLMTYGSMGGDGQPQFQSQIFTRHVDFGMDLGAAIDAPRFLLGKTWGDETLDLKMEDRFDPDLVEALRRAGHEVRVLSEAYTDGMGHAGAIVRRADGRLFGASDPRSDGAAVGV
jgi:gamma-glutamyltranspeptidase/glutathione hydrolase